MPSTYVTVCHAGQHYKRAQQRRLRRLARHGDCREFAADRAVLLRRARLQHPRGALGVQAARRADEREQRADEREDDDRVAPLAEVVEYGNHREHKVNEQDAPADELPEQVGVFFPRNSYCLSVSVTPVCTFRMLQAVRRRCPDERHFRIAEHDVRLRIRDDCHAASRKT